MNKKILFSICSLGMGHATRSLALIKKLLPENEIFIISTGNALNFLKEELKDHPVSFFEYEDYPALERGGGVLFFLYLFFDLAKTVFLIHRENKFVRELAKMNKINLIISDGRYGSYAKNIPSLLITHQVRLFIPKILWLYQPLVDQFNLIFFQRFNCVLIPDYERDDYNLAGRMSHNELIKKINHQYIGILSSYQKLPAENNIDYLFIVSGFLEEQKKSFVADLKEQSQQLPGKKVFILGDTMHNFHEFDLGNNIEIFSYVVNAKRQELFNRAKIIISRSGYTTIMDLVELDKNALLVPTRNQTEQEYLAEYLKEKGYFSTAQSEVGLKLKESLTGMSRASKFIAPWKTDESAIKADAVISKYLNVNFISIVVPARNEEKVIEKTLKHLAQLHYPKEKYEVIVVENGSTDLTYSLAKAKEKDNIRVYAISGGGVSKARNYGLSQTAEQSNWVIFLDADTFLGADFLFELNNYLNKRADDDLAVGTTYVMPDSTLLKAKYWFKFYNFGHKFTKSSFALQILNKSVAKDVRYDESLKLGEDLKLINDARKYGHFFCLETDQVSTSIRRFEKEGWLYLFLDWNFKALMPYALKKKLAYKVIR